MAREFHVDVDLKGALLLNGSAGTPGQTPISAGPGQPASWGGAPGGGGGPITQTAQVISQNITLTAGYNAFSVGPVEIASGYSITIPTNSTWAIL